MACRILPDQRSSLCSLHWQADSLPLDHKGSPALCSSATTSRVCHHASQVLPYFRVFPLGAPLSGTPHPPLHTYFMPLSPSLKTGFCPSLGLKDVTSSKRPSLTTPSPPTTHPLAIFYCHHGSYRCLKSSGFLSASPTRNASSKTENPVSLFTAWNGPWY